VFLAPLQESAWEIRGFFRDPDGHLLEISEAKAGVVRAFVTSAHEALILR